MRKLASIQRIISAEPIEGADAIEKATILGWQVVIKKGEFKPGDLCLYCEIDSVLPEKPEFEFLKPRKMRIKTIKLRGQISQGICFPLSVLPAGTEANEGADVTEVMGITKFEIPIPAHLAGEVKGYFPGFIPKTDETRVQVLQEMLDRNKGTICYISEKLDGSSVTYYMKDGQFGVCSRNLELKENAENTLWKLAREYDLENKLQALNRNYALQGEVIGEGVQGNKYKIKGQAVLFFNAVDIPTHSYLGFEEFKKLMTETLSLKIVPIIRTDFELINDIPKLVELSAGKSLLSDVQREGIVIRPLFEKQDPIGRVSFKVVNPEFLLKYE
ncbi:MAG: RNA ligase (ATP) [Bacteroidetes bacterium]|nr:RNA ligase (ATP) [Bacteroidota bacterium]